MIPEVTLTGWEGKDLSSLKNTKILQTPNNHVRHENVDWVNIYRKFYMNYDNTKNIESKMLELNIKFNGKIFFFQQATTKISWYMLLIKIVSCLWIIKKLINYAT